jgi:hypothetical protein
VWNSGASASAISFDATSVAIYRRPRRAARASAAAPFSMLLTGSSLASKKSTRRERARGLGHGLGRRRSSLRTCRQQAASCRPQETLSISHSTSMGGALAAAELGYALLPAQPFQHDAELPLGLKVSTGSDRVFRRLLLRSRFLSHSLLGYIDPEIHLTRKP